MSTWILVLYVSYMVQAASVTSTPGFASKDACSAAYIAIGASFEKSAGTRVRFACVSTNETLADLK